MPAEILPLTLAFMVLPGAEAMDPMPITFDLAGVIVDREVGTGRALESGDTVQFHYVISEVGGKVLADSEKRGLAFRLSPGSEGPIDESALANCLLGVRPGGVRRIFTDGPALGFQGDGLVPPGVRLEITFSVLAVSRRGSLPG